MRWVVNCERQPADKRPDEVSVIGAERVLTLEALGAERKVTVFAVRIM